MTEPFGRIASCSGVRFGPSLLHVGLGYNQISSVAGIANDAEVRAAP